MRSPIRTFAILFVVVLSGSLAGCSSPSTLRVTAIQVGRSLNADNTVASSAASFSPRDTIYASVLTTGRGSATISVRWTYGGQVLDEPKKQVRYNDFAATDFSLKSVAGFPPGQYAVEAFLDGQSVGKQTFQVQ
jgi:hypothetical protein